MKTISVSEFRGNIKKYLDIAQEEKSLIHRGKANRYFQHSNPCLCRLPIEERP